MGAFGPLPAPPCGDVGKRKVLAIQVAADAGQEGEQRPHLQYPGTDGVDDGGAAAAHGVDEARRADARIVLQFERVHEGRVETSPQHAERPRTIDGAHHDLAAGDREVLALEQQQAEIAGDIGVLEIGLGVLAGGEHRDAFRIVGKLEQSVAEIAEKAGEPVNVHGALDFGERARGGDTVLQSEAGA